MLIISIEIIKTIDERKRYVHGGLWWDELIAKCN